MRRGSEFTAASSMAGIVVLLVGGLAIASLTSCGGSGGSPGPTNAAPTVNAGSDRTGAVGQAMNLDGTVNDDGLPASPGATTATWSKVSGPGNVTFANAKAVDTTATFSAVGEYVLRLSATDGDKTSTDEVTVTVTAVGTNQAPTVSAGADTSVVRPNAVNLDGTVTDDGLPAGASVTSTWSQVSVDPAGGTATFGNANATDTTATFSAAGTYTLRLTADDTELQGSDDVVVTVTEPAPTNAAPVAAAGPDRTIERGQSATLAGNVTDDGKPDPPAAVTAKWTKKSGPGTVTFANANVAGTTATFSVSGTYVLTLTANDGAKTGTDDVQVTVTKPVVTGPAVSSFSPEAYTVGQPMTVTLEITPEATVSVYAVEDAIPSGWAVTEISDSGSFDAVNGKVKWGPFFDHTARTLTYKVTPPTGTTGQKTFTGTASFDGTDTAVIGDRDTSPAS